MENHPKDVTLKHNYIHSMHEIYKKLSVVQDNISEAGSKVPGIIQKITINKNHIIAYVENPKFKYLINLDDKRDCALESLNFNGFEPVDCLLIYNAANFASNNSETFTFMDIGANGGWYSCALGSLFNNINIFAFEPVPQTYHRLIKNISLNLLEAKVKAYNYAVSDSSGTKEFFYSKSLSGNASFSNLLEDTIDKEKISVESINIDSYFDKGFEYPVKFIKIDCEGSELYVTKSVKSLLSRDRPFVFIELSRKWCAAFGYHPNEVLENLCENMNYKCISIDENLHIHMVESITDATIMSNFLFVPNEIYNDFVKGFVNSVGITS